VDYSVLENDFDCACNDVISELSKLYKAEYKGGGPGRLEAFLDLIKNAFEKAEGAFIETSKISHDPVALKRIRDMAKIHVKKCVDVYSKLH